MIGIRVVILADFAIYLFIHSSIFVLLLIYFSFFICLRSKKNSDRSGLSSSSSTPTTPSSSMPSSPRKTHSYETPPTSPKCVRGTSPHFDRRFFDSALIEIKSQASSSSTLDDSSNDDVWVKRIDAVEIARRKRVSWNELSCFILTRALLNFAQVRTLFRKNHALDSTDKILLNFALKNLNVPFIFAPE